MSDLTFVEQRLLEKLFGMGGGYVLNFSNNTFADFIEASVGRAIYDQKYENGSGSKANRLRAFWKIESNHVVAKLLEALLEYQLGEEELVHDSDGPRIEACRRTIARLRTASPVAEIDALAQIGNEHDLEVVARAVRDSIDKNEPVVGLDRLHTFATGFLRSLCAKRGVAMDKSKPLNSIFGEYVRQLREAGHLESKMTVNILKSMFAPLEAFNQVRNDQTLAHDNTLLNHDEALLIFNHVTSSLRFLRDLEHRLDQAERAQQVEAEKTVAFDEDIPF